MKAAPYILFVMRVPTCQTVLQLARMYGPSVIEVVDVQAMPQRPPWLTGVPTLISRTNQFAPLTGETIHRWLQQGLQQQQSRDLSINGSNRSSSGPQHQQQGTCVGDVCELPSSSTEPMAQGSSSGFAYVGATSTSEYASVKESLYSRKKKIGDQDVEAYMRMRETPAQQPPSYVGVSDVDGHRVTM